MKFYYPKDMSGNIIGFKTPESQVYDKTGKSLTDKLNEIYEGTKELGNSVSVQGYEPNTLGKKGLATILSDYGVTKLGNSIEFHTKDDTSYTAKLTVNNDGDIHIDNQYNKASLLRYNNLHDDETDINTLVSTGIYRCSTFINYPPEHISSQGTVFVFNYGYGNSSVNTAIIGDSSLWITQIFLSAHNNSMWKRYVSDKTITSWVLSSVQDIMSYNDVDMISFVEDVNYCPEGTISKYRLYHPTNAPVSNSDFNIEVYKLNDSTIRIIAHHVESTSIFTNVKVNNTWSGWKNINDGGNANSVQSYTPNTSGKKGLATILTDYGIMEIGNTLDFHTADNQDFVARLSTDSNGLLHVANQFDSDVTLIRYKNFGDTAVNVNNVTASGIYRSSSFVNYPPSSSDGQGTLIVINYTNVNAHTSNVMGTNDVWLTQIYIAAHSHTMWKRYCNGKNVSAWKNMDDGGNADTLAGSDKFSFIFKDGSNQFMNPVTDLNTFYTGIGLFNSSTLNLPSQDWFMVISGGMNGTTTQVAFNLFNNTRPKTRNCAAGTWTEWMDVRAEFLPSSGGYFGAGKHGNLYADGNVVILYANSVASTATNSNALMISNEKYASVSTDSLSLRTTRSGSTVDYVIHNDGNSSRVKITSDGTTSPSNTNTLWAY